MAGARGHDRGGVPEVGLAADHPIRVVLVNPVGTIGGAERVLLAVADAVRPTAAVLFAPGPLADALTARSVPVHILPLPPALAGFGDTRRPSRLDLLRAAVSAPAVVPFLRRFGQLLRRLRPTHVHSNGLKVHLLTAAAAPGVPVVWHLHDFLSPRPLAGRLLRIARRRAAHAVAISDAVAADAATVLPGLPTTVVRNAVDLAHFAPGPADGSLLDQLAGLPPTDRVRAVLVATYARWKGQDVFLEALARTPAVRGYIVGGPIYSTAGSQWTRAELEALADRLGVTAGFVPFQPDPADVYRAADIVVHASTKPEPFGLTIAEGMACGRPVVVSAAGGAVELFTDGVNALARPPGGVAALAAALHRLAADPELRQRLGNNARLTAEDRFGPDRFARELLAVYARIR